jgi:hypothetical protein
MIKYVVPTIALALLLTVPRVNAQEGPKAFHKYCVVASVTGGPSKVLYTTKDGNGKTINSEIVNGYIDPVITEYGLTNRIGLGFTAGGDNFRVDANKFYGQNIPESACENLMPVYTKYRTIDISYHYFTTKRLDLSVFGSAGTFKLSGMAYTTISEYSTEASVYNYNSRGGIVRTGARARWYYSKRWGAMAMLYGYKSYAKEPHKINFISDAKGTGGISTSLTGIGFEIGICVRFGKQSNAHGTILTKKEKLRKINKDNEEKERLITVIGD